MTWRQKDRPLCLTSEILEVPCQNHRFVHLIGKNQLRKINGLLDWDDDGLLEFDCIMFIKTQILKI